MTRRLSVDLAGDFDEAIGALLAVKPPPSGKKAVARKKKRGVAKKAIARAKARPSAATGKN